MPMFYEISNCDKVIEDDDNWFEEECMQHAAWACGVLMNNVD
jgi:hypothetical protein